MMSQYAQSACRLSTRVGSWRQDETPHRVFHCLAGDGVRHMGEKVVRTRRLAGREIEFSQSAVEGGATHAEKACGFGPVPAGLSEGGDESTTFVGRDGFRRKLGRLPSKLRRKIRRFERVPFAVNHRAFDRTLEFPHVAGPVVVHQGRHG